MAANIAPVQVPLTNGAVRSFGHVRMSMGGMDFFGGFTAIKRSRKRNREMARSNSVDPVGKTLGENEFQCSVDLYYDWFMTCIQTVQSTLGVGYGDQSFTLYVSYVGVNLQEYTDIIVGGTIDTTEADDQQGTKALMRNIELNPLKIYFGGLDDAEDPLIPNPYG